MVKKKQEGKYRLFDVEEFSDWLNALSLKRKITLIQNHHTEIPSYKDFHGDNHFALQQEMEEAHLARNFDEIAQQLTIFPDGMICTGRSMELDPAGIRGANKGAICIENLGNFNKGNDEITEVQRKAILTVNVLLCKKFELIPSTKTLVYHHWYDRETGERTGGTGVTKTCPGANFFGGNSIEDAEKNFIPLI